MGATDMKNINKDDLDLKNRSIFPRLICKTCGKELICEEDVLRCFRAEHDLPAVSEQLDFFPADRITRTLYVAIIACGLVRKGVVRFIPPNYFALVTH